jgi:3-methyladenine DNA glycosylase AlkD
MARQPCSRDEAVSRLRSRARAANRAGMARYGIATAHALGVSMVDIRAVARGIAHDHALALALWDSGIHEARILAALVDKPQWVDPGQMDRWAGDFDSWDLCDQVCGNLFDKTPFAHAKAMEWAADEREFVRRAAFAMMAWRAVHDRDGVAAARKDYLGLIERHAGDPRNFVRKSVNWALRQMGKSRRELHGPCLALARKLAASSDKTARWIGRDAVKELESGAVRDRLGLPAS